jgi:hypothetical protein
MSTQINTTIESIVSLIPEHLKQWVIELKPSEIANILSMFGETCIKLKHVVFNPDEINNNTLEQGPPITDTRVLAEVAEPVYSSAHIGMIGEEEISNILKKRYDVQNTSKTGKCGDIIVKVNNINILVEVKKYKSTVPKAEVEKFHRDIDANASSHCGLMISLTSKIIGYSKNIELSHCYIHGDKVPVLFLSLHNIKNEQAYQEYIYASVDILVANVINKQLFTNVKQNINYDINHIELSLDNLSQSRLIIDESQVFIQRQFNKLTTQMITSEINMKNDVLNLKKHVNNVVVVVPQIDDEKKEETDQLIKDILNPYKLDSDMYNMLYMCIPFIKGAKSEKNIISSGSGTTPSIKIMKTITRISFAKSASLMENLYELDYTNWTYDGKLITITINTLTFNTILKFLNL